MKDFTTMTIERKVLKDLTKIKARKYPKLINPDLISNGQIVKEIIDDSEELFTLKQRGAIYLDQDKEL